ncbi:MAG: type II toxin-antitoxin system VapC family toxin [Acidobacteria bacterium]|nr:type II toxin-antitoxin system VapC family toxin [Acidobacteriota bacterium]
MRVLLDTHAFVWWVADSRRLSETASGTIRNEGNDILVSAASAWEVATKHRLGKFPEADALASDIRAAIARQGFEELPVSVGDAERAGRLTGPHRDPFDRMLIAQALARDLAIVSNERVFDLYGVNRLW